MSIWWTDDIDELSDVDSRRDDYCAWMVLCGLFETVLVSNEIANMDWSVDPHPFTYDVEQDTEYLEELRKWVYSIDISMWNRSHWK